MDLTPKQIVSELDKFIIGQTEAKRAVAVALRNRFRRSKLPKEVRDEITPKNIIMKGPTGVGKTEIARRISKIVKAPFVKVEATKYTEVGYVGRDVESMVRDLVEVSIRMVKEEMQAEIQKKAETLVERRLVTYIVATKKRMATDVPDEVLRQQSEMELRDGKLETMLIEVDIVDTPKPMAMPMGMEIGINIGDIFGNMMPKRTKKKHMTVEDARAQLLQEE